MGYTLKKHQKEGIKYLLENKYAVLADGMGLGKTLQAIEVVKRTGFKAVIVCPAMLRQTWANELVKFSDLKPSIFYSPTKYEEGNVAIISYASAYKFEDLFIQADIVICDEAHFLKNLSAKRTEVAHTFIKRHRPEYLLMLTGTAIKNRVPEIYSLLVLCGYGSHFTGRLNITDKYPNYWSFCRRFCNVSEFNIKGRTITKFEGHRNVDELKTYLEGCYIRRRASEVLDLPPIVRKDIVIDNNHIDHELLQAWNEGKKAYATKKLNSAKIKVKHTVKYVKDLLEQGEGPILIFSDHVWPAEELASSLKGKAITGDTPMKKRDEIVEKFQEGKIQVLAATIGSLSVGVTLTRASNIVFNDLPWVPGDLAQCEKRIHRIGQTKHCTIHRIFWGKVDVKIGKELDKKIETLVEIL